MHSGNARIIEGVRLVRPRYARCGALPAAIHTNEDLLDGPEGFVVSQVFLPELRLKCIAMSSRLSSFAERTSRLVVFVSTSFLLRVD